MGDTKADIIREHLPYEVRMMRYTARELEHPFEDDLANNAVIEANAVHLRNLLDFLYNQNGDFQAKDFVPTNHLLSGKQTFPSDVGRLSGFKLHDQILHMGEKRTTVEANKLSAADRKILIDAIKKQACRVQGRASTNRL